MKTAFNGKSKLLVSAVAALFATVAYTAYAADSDVKTGNMTNKTQGRAIDGAVQTDPSKAAKKQGRAIDSEVKAGGMTNKTQGRAIEGAVQTDPAKAAKKQGRAIEDVKAGDKKVDTQGRAIDDVKAGGKTTDVQGRAVEK